MVVSALARPMLRSPVLRMAAARRLESTAASRAQEGLSRVTSAAGPAIAGAAKGVANALGKVGGRTGRVIAFVERQTPLVLYYSKVGLELTKLVFQSQKMSPPSMATFQTYYQNLWRSLQTGTIFRAPANLVQQIRNVSNVQLAAGAVVFAECLGFFTAGEMLGRFKLVGYHGEPGSHH
ncbi:hypothetical protein DCS_06095 [Drechmeria coniospora]|uniref:ATP synthase subunit g n=1 Tax=Drechmeria coniospora TaxID=98403 RepID=A0A151GAN0_DRECN|nr:hypothetical protein DCS_06095 [Drechmeria coniospora]KYK54138.1 hypothetical protein DCS_06095 [Drechmeria coniospora]ODA77555.1 hypothetical protein RJ55_07184 [Drechmeria coniospora]